MKYLLGFSLALLGLMSCTTEADQGVNRWSDGTLREIYDHQDRRETEPLLEYLQHEEAKYRAAAALAFGSVQDSTALPALKTALSDANAAVRKNAAFAIGQTGHADGFDVLKNAMATEQDHAVKGVMLEAMGKCVTEATLPELVGLSVNSAEENQGKMWGIYRAGLKRVTSAPATQLAVQRVASSKDQIEQLAAANYLARVSGLDISAHANVIGQMANQHPSHEVRMALVRALGKADAPRVEELLAEVLKNEPNANVRINAWSSLKPEHFDAVQNYLPKALTAADPNEAVAATGYLARLEPAHMKVVLEQVNLEQVASRPRAAILGLMIAHDLANNAEEHLMVCLDTTTNRYAKADYLGALGSKWSHLPLIKGGIENETDPVLSTAAMGALDKLVNMPEIPDDQEDMLVGAIQAGFTKGDLASVALASYMVLNENVADLKPRFQEPAFRQSITQAKDQLELPRDVETMIALVEAENYLDGVENAEAVTNPYNHPIDWDRVAQIKPDQKVLIKTNRGLIEWTLNVEDAPGSVINFIDLVEQGYYNGKTLHRVVPNFVAQGGCPRGDGYGGMDYSIRSEFTHLRYSTGAVGLASAGKDTESCQWFMTHSPTPHLDGRYTIFAYVTGGQGTVQILQQGDVIESVELE